MITPLILYLDVPFATFRESHAREMGKTYPVPPPSTVYGMLLSLVGETNVYRHCGVELAIAMLSKPEKSRILRQMRRFKNTDFSHPENINPAYQEILSNLKCMIWVRSDTEKSQPSLKERIQLAFDHPELVKRFGCLFLGESDQLLKTIKLVPEDYLEGVRRWVIRDYRGELTLPYWVDHVGSRNTRFLRYRVDENSRLSPPDLAWTTIQSPI
ncbi:type I-MYXAN CRISPR-associated protein Cas5/Cmx5/DevS [Aphanothece hegewaldii CCALA 016]|uniref:Type I-MYXAN CRISPR-associated protein Cas5/Cmx5/DevS n=1 Tax=Aphanothece hegewaldii CCALA 016 TaxID=2107694 RepID=A0A2T1LZY9_9CHRO|nr:type I-MYXAN CRISPR-associated protein Cas5/Cmx5/DevS [Aphanothece hegewaldii]PSF37989.1 type I-MYXAN CRISPR-associated protein Cas5/Cmx5/DevS [Aphanothece hegewaldii CCALA 016]